MNKLSDNFKTHTFDFSIIPSECKVCGIVLSGSSKAGYYWVSFESTSWNSDHINIPTCNELLMEQILK